MTKARKHSKKGIKTTPKTARQYQKAVNQTLWRKYHATRETLGLQVADIRKGFTDEVSVLEFCASLVA